MALPLTGLVSQLEPSLQGLLIQASSRWHSKPAEYSTSASQDRPSCAPGSGASIVAVPRGQLSTQALLCMAWDISLPKELQFK